MAAEVEAVKRTVVETELVYGVNPVLAALKAGRRRVRRVWIADGKVKDPRVAELVRLAEVQSVPVEHASRRELSARVGDSAHQGVAADAARAEGPTLAEVIEGSRTTALLVALDQVQDPRNLGAILRAAAAAGAQAVIAPGRRQAPLSPAALKVAEGAGEYVPLVRVGNLSQALASLRKAGVWVVGLDPGAELPWDEVDFTLPTVLLMGSEGRGLRALVRRGCDRLAALPVAGGVDSLNVASAAAVALYEAVRQRRRAALGSGGDRVARGRQGVR